MDKRIIRANCDPARLSRATGTILLACDQKQIRSVALCTATHDIDLAPLLHAFHHTIQNLRPHMDLHLQAAPAILRRPDTPSIAAAADATLLVVLAGRSHTENIRQAFEHLTTHSALFLGTLVAEARNPVPWPLRHLLGVRL